MNQEKQTVQFTLFSLQLDRKPKWGDIKHIEFREEDEIWIGYDEGYYSENNSWDPHYFVKVFRHREETDAELEKRLQQAAEQKEELRARRYENYLKLKKEFES